MKTTRRVSPAMPSTESSTETGKTPTPITPAELAIGFVLVRSSGIRAVGAWSNDVALKGPIRA